MPKILLVEDDNNLREIFAMRLQAEGYETLTAGDGEEGLTVAMQQRPDLIISDVMMPKLSGFEMLETLRAAPEGKDVKVIMMTALGQAEDRSRGEHLGVIKYLVKSQATLEDFARVVGEVLPAGNQTNEAPKSNQESEKNMQEDPSTNPMTPPADNPAPTPPADPMAPAANPVGDVTGGQQTTADEQNAVNAQVNDFVASAPVADSSTPPVDGVASVPAPDTSATTPMDNPVAAPSDSGMGADAPAADTTTDAPVIPPATPPVDVPPAPAPESEVPATEAPTTPPSDPSANTI